MNIPEMYYGDSSRLGRPFAKDPSVIKFAKKYWMYYSMPPFDPKLAPPDAPKGWGIGIATSTDLTHWTKVGEMLGKPGTVEESGPGARVLDGKVHLFYQTYGMGPKDAICHAVSQDGLHFDHDPSNPIFRPNGAWNCGRAIDAEVFPVGDKLYLYYATRDPAFKIQLLGVAVAELKSDFGRAVWTNLSTDGPMLAPELPWERDCIEAATICQRGKTLFLFYAGAYNNAPQQIGVATSTDGVRWKRLSDQPLLANGKPGEWNASESGHPGIFDERGKTVLFFQGNNDKGKTWFLSQRRIVWTKGNLPALENETR
jgi:predicted GH43/DUF377 family glycosyl hydrolase